MHRFLCLLLLLAAAALPARAAEPAPDGWTITKTPEPKVCVASGPADGAARLSIASEGPLFLLLVSAPDFPTAKASYSVSLSIDGHPAIPLPALGDKGTMAINIGRGAPTAALAAASGLAVTVDGKTHGFTLRNVGAAFDAVARCAGQPLLAEQRDRPIPIRGAAGWTLDENLPGAPGVCLARIAGDQVDILLMLNNDGDLVLGGGHGDWASWGGQVPLELAVDGQAPVKLTASTVNNLVLASIKDPALLQKLRAAKSLQWSLPNRQVRADVAGLGTALDAAKACRARRAK